MKRKAPMPGPGLAASHPAVAHTAGEPSQGLQQPISRSATPSSGALANHFNHRKGQNSTNLFDQLETAALAEDGGHFNEAGSLDAASDQSAGDSLSSVMKANSVLRTRVSELEFVNDLFQGRVKELEKNELELQEKLRNYESCAGLAAQNADGGIQRNVANHGLNSRDPNKRRKKSKSDECNES